MARRSHDSSLRHHAHCWAFIFFLILDRPHLYGSVVREYDSAGAGGTVMHGLRDLSYHHRSAIGGIWTSTIDQSEAIPLLLSPPHHPLCSLDRLPLLPVALVHGL